MREDSFEMKARILLIESEPESARNLSGLLKAEGLDVEAEVDGVSGLTKASSGKFDLVILDAALSGLSGFDVCRELRRLGIDTAILMLAAKTLPAERVAALRLGADDCISRQCDASECIARIEALLRRVPGAVRNPARVLRFGDVAIDFGIPEVRKGGCAVSMAAMELRLLRYLAEHRHKVVSRQEILRNVWDYDVDVPSRTVDVHVGWLRQKLEDDPRNPKHIKTVRNRGYRFDWDDHG